MSHSPRSGWIEISRIAPACPRTAGPTPHGVGGLKSFRTAVGFPHIGPTPHGVGGLKSAQAAQSGMSGKSHSPRSGWIEILYGHEIKPYYWSPTPHGVGGLKFIMKEKAKGFVMSHSPRSGWIEINILFVACPKRSCPTPHGVGGLKCTVLYRRLSRVYVPLPTEWVD